MTGIARIFPRKTKASPDDGLMFFGEPPDDLPDINEFQREWVRPAIIATKLKTGVIL